MYLNPVEGRDHIVQSMSTDQSRVNIFPTVGVGRHGPTDQAHGRSRRRKCIETKRHNHSENRRTMNNIVQPSRCAEDGDSIFSSSTIINAQDSQRNHGWRSTSRALVTRSKVADHTDLGAVDGRNGGGRWRRKWNRHTVTDKWPGEWGTGPVRLGLRDEWTYSERRTPKPVMLATRVRSWCTSRALRLATTIRHRLNDDAP